MKISYLGPRNTYTEQAAILLAEKIPGETELVEARSLEAIAKNVSSRETDRGVMPHYNYLEGLVQESLDLIYENGLFINGLQRLPIELSAGEHESNDEKAVYSHPKALAQCSDWLWNVYGSIEKIEMDSTAAAARRVAETRSGIAIANYPALEANGLQIIERNVGNKKNNRSNFTDFYLVSTERENGVDSEKSYLTMVAITPHHDEPGLLAGILNQVAYHNLNNAKIHSRPALDDFSGEGYGQQGIEPQMFYLEVMDHQNSEDFKRCMDSLRYKLDNDQGVETVRVLGSYEMPRS